MSSLDEHWIVAKIETVDGMPVIGEQVSINGQTEFASREDCWSALAAADAVSWDLHPIRMPKSARYIITLPEVPK